MKRYFVLTALFLWVAPLCAAPPMTLAEYELGWAHYYARADHVPEDLVEAIMIVESGGNPYAVSSKGAAGVMQLMPATAYDYCVRNRFLVQENIRAGVAYLAALIGEFHGDLRLAVASYYAGSRRIEAQKLACSSPPVYNYVCRVAVVYRRLQARRR
ncbi:MAG: lytic transglycosylase domain-containing protein [Terriglobia bacterium]